MYTLQDLAIQQCHQCRHNLLLFLRTNNLLGNLSMYHLQYRIDLDYMRYIRYHLKRLDIFRYNQDHRLMWLMYPAHNILLMDRAIQLSHLLVQVCLHLLSIRNQHHIHALDILMFGRGMDNSDQLCTLCNHVSHKLPIHRCMFQEDNFVR